MASRRPGRRVSLPQGDALAEVRQTCRRVVQLSGSGVVSSVFGMASAVLFARYLPPAEYGAALTVIAFCGVVGAWTGLGVEQMLVSDVARARGEGEQETARRLVWEYTFLKLALSGLLIVGLCALGLTRRLPAQVQPFLWAIALLIGADAVSCIVRTILSSCSQFQLVALLGVGEAAMRLLGACAVGVMTVGSGHHVIVLQSLSLLIPACVVAASYWSSLLSKPKVAPDREGLLAVLKAHGKWNLALGVTMSLVDPLPVLILSSVLGREAVAIYHVATRLVGFLQIPLGAAESALAPILAGLGSTGPDLIARVTRYLFVSSVGLMAAGALVAPTAITLMLSEQYRGAVGMSLWLLLEIPSRALRAHQRPVFFILRRQDLVLASYLVASGAWMLATLPMTWVLGLTGFALAQVSGGGMVFAIRNRQLRRLGFGVSFRSLWEFDDLDRRALQAGLHKLMKGSVA